MFSQTHFQNNQWSFLKKMTAIQSVISSFVLFSPLRQTPNSSFKIVIYLISIIYVFFKDEDLKFKDL